jgi:formate transporter
MDYVKPADVAVAMLDVGKRKLALGPSDLLIRGMLSGALLGVATSLAFTGAVQTGQPLVGAIIFPVGLIAIVLLGLELITGSFALTPLPWLNREASASAVLINWGWVFIGNLIGSVAFGALLAIALTNMGTAAPTGVAARIVQIAELKTTGYAAIGFAGLVTAFVKAVLCNWLVCLAVVLAMTTTSTIGKIACAWMPIFIFFAQGFEHSVVNMFIIPTGMMMGAKVTVADWWLWNSDSGNARQSGRRLHLHRACHLRDLQAARGNLNGVGDDADPNEYSRRIAL